MLMTVTLPPVYPILNIDAESSEQWADTMITAVIQAGIDLIQLRVKNVSDAVHLSWASFCQQRCEAANIRLVVNDRPDIASIVGASGVHLGQSDQPADLVRQRFGPGLFIGSSCHSITQLKGRSEATASIDYLALGPIFNTSSKANAEPTLGVDILEIARDHLREIQSPMPLVAIGGIQIENIQSVLERGADSVAMISALGDANTVHQRLEEALSRAKT